jgi:hypothetical protein
MSTPYCRSSHVSPPFFWAAVAALHTMDLSPPQRVTGVLYSRRGPDSTAVVGTLFMYSARDGEWMFTIGSWVEGRMSRLQS